MAAIGKIFSFLAFLVFIAINATALMRMEQFNEELEEAGSATPSTFLKLAQGAELTADDVYRPVRLSESERAEQVTVCIGVDRYGQEYCDCLVNAIEDRVTGMQFKLAMLSLKRRSGEESLTKLPELKAYSNAAAAHGMRLEDFKRDVLATRESVASARKQCSHKS